MEKEMDLIDELCKVLRRFREQDRAVLSKDKGLHDRVLAVIEEELHVPTA